MRHHIGVARQIEHNHVVGRELCRHCWAHRDQPTSAVRTATTAPVYSHDLQLLRLHLLPGPETNAADRLRSPSPDCAARPTRCIPSHFANLYSFVSIGIPYMACSRSSVVSDCEDMTGNASAAMCVKPWGLAGSKIPVYPTTSVSPAAIHARPNRRTMSWSRATSTTQGHLLPSLIPATQT
jgi:hypothetical protein